MGVYWVVVAIDYSIDKAFILDRSEDLANADIFLDEDTTEDIGLDNAWMKELRPGLYLLRLGVDFYEDGYNIYVKGIRCLGEFPDVD